MRHGWRRNEESTDDGPPIRESLGLPEPDRVVLEGLPADMQLVGLRGFDAPQHGDAQEAGRLAEHLGDCTLHCRLELGVAIRRDLDAGDFENYG